MQRLIIQGGSRLNGEITVQGAKKRSSAAAGRVCSYKRRDQAT